MSVTKLFPANGGLVRASALKPGDQGKILGQVIRHTLKTITNDFPPWRSVFRGKHSHLFVSARIISVVIVNYPGN